MARRAAATKTRPDDGRGSGSPSRADVLASLGVFGWGGVEPVLVAALATEEPVLLLGPHGTAKSLVLNRLADGLGLRHRHYNASLLNFDDLVGYPVPSEDRSHLVYVPTASSIWDAESVLFDEISRCRIDLQNKLFPIIHERVVQGLPLPKLRYRWAAMNPPARPEAQEEDEDGVDVYRGSEPLPDRLSLAARVDRGRRHHARRQTAVPRPLNGTTPPWGADERVRGAFPLARSRRGQQGHAFVAVVALVVLCPWALESPLE